MRRHGSGTPGGTGGAAPNAAKAARAALARRSAARRAGALPRLCLPARRNRLKGESRSQAVRHESQSWQRAVLKSLQFARIGSALVIGMLLQACGSLPRLDAVPPALTERAAISGIPNSRYWLDSDLGPFIQDAIQDTKRESEALAEAGEP